MNPALPDNDTSRGHASKPGPSPRSFVWWLLQIVPPFLLFPLSAMPFDIGTSPFWAAGTIAAGISIFELVYRAAIHFGKRDPLSLDLTRPALTTLCVATAFRSMEHSSSAAREFASITAEHTQRSCNANGSCPETLSGWKERHDRLECETEAGGLAGYRVLYDASDAGTELQRVLYINMDWTARFRGDTGKPLVRQGQKEAGLLPVAQSVGRRPDRSQSRATQRRSSWAGRARAGYRTS